MSLKDNVRAIRVETLAERQRALQVLQATYRREKNWVHDEQKVFPTDDLTNLDVSWFMVSVADAPVGVLRVLYNPPLDLYRQYGFKQLVQGLDIEEFCRTHRIAEIGRFAVMPEYRKYITVVGALMREAARETVECGFSHYITDIFEGEAHSPYNFHTRVMGFQPVATHDVGELNCPNRRITLILDLQAAYHRLRTTQRWVYRFLTENWSESLHQKLNENIAASQNAAANSALPQDAAALSRKG
jgi:hypothetical protein